MAIIIGQFDYPNPDEPDNNCWTVVSDDIIDIDSGNDELGDFPSLEQAITFCNENNHTPYTIKPMN